MTLELWIVLGIALVGIVSGWIERRRERIEKRARQLSGDYS